MAELRLSVSAQKDLAGIDGYSARQFGYDAADGYMRGFREAFDRLRAHPHVGQARPEYGKNIRCLMHRRHRVLYTVADDVVVILRVLHHARDASLPLQ